MKTTFDYEHYADAEEIAERLRYFADHYPHYTRLSALIQTPEGRNVWAMEVTDLRTGDFADKPAQHIDGNTHAGEVTGSMAALHQLDVLLTQCDQPEIKRLLERFTFTFIPRISPDGAEVYLKTPYSLRSVNRTQAERPAPEGLVKEDLDQDGVIRMLRRKDPAGAWKADEHDPRLMVLRRPDDMDGTFYQLLPEGRVQGRLKEPVGIAAARWDLDFNRNYPCWWKPDQPGAGSYPLDNPETRAVAEFIAGHPQIGVMVTHHTSGGMLLYPPGPYSQSEQDPDDRAVYQSIGELGTQETGYPLLNLYDGFHCTPQDYAAGAGDDWAYLNRGIFAVTLELWDMLARAGIPVEQQLDPDRGESLKEQELTLALAWIDQHCPQAWKKWQTYDHPQLGMVEIGGLDQKFVVQNCPPSYLRQECEKATRFALRQVCLLPRLAIQNFTAEVIDDRWLRVKATVSNLGYLPTWISRQKQALGLARMVRIELSGAMIVEGEAVREIEGLEGYSLDQTCWSMTGVSGQPSGSRLDLSWLVQSEASSTLRLTCSCIHAGKAEAELKI